MNANENGRIVHDIARTFLIKVNKIKTYKNLYPKIYSYNNLLLAYKKAKKRKSSKKYVIDFQKDKQNNLLKIKKELENQTYKPSKLTKIIIRDPKTRTINKSQFKDRIVHHTIVNILEPIYEKVFINDNYANRKNKGTLKAVQRFDKFKRKTSNNGKLVKYNKNDNMVKGYILKADIKRFFETIDQDVLINMLRRKLKDKKLILLIKQILSNYEGGGAKQKGMPLGNMTSQFLANVYLNELDYLVKHKLKAKYYLRYVDDFIILHQSKQQLIKWKEEINNFLNNKLKLELHKDKTKIISMHNGVNFLGYKLFYYFRLLRKRNINTFRKILHNKIKRYKNNQLDKEKLLSSIDGWFGYAQHANTYNLRKSILKEVSLTKNDKQTTLFGY